MCNICMFKTAIWWYIINWIYELSNAEIELLNYFTFFFFLICDLFKCWTSLVFFLEGLNADNIRQASEQLKSRWIEFCQLLSERLAWLEYQNNIIDFYSQLQQLEQTAITAENWLKTQPAPATDPATVKAQLEKCKVRDSSPSFL